MNKTVDEVERIETNPDDTRERVCEKRGLARLIKNICGTSVPQAGFDWALILRLRVPVSLGKVRLTTI